MHYIKFSSGDSPVFEGYVLGYNNFDNGYHVLPLVSEETYKHILLWLKNEIHVAQFPDEYTKDEGMILSWVDLSTAPEFFAKDWHIFKVLIKQKMCKKTDRFFNIGARISHSIPWEEIGEGVHILNW